MNQSIQVIINKFEKLFTILINPFLIFPLFKGVAAGTEHIAQLRNLKVSFFVDIGANRGQFALVARKCFPNAKIFSFEPLPGPAGIFRKVFKDDRLTHLEQVAIGPVEDKMILHETMNDDSSSLLKGHLQNQIFPGTQEVGAFSVSVKPLSALLTEADIVSPALLKIDVQGYELEVLKGCGSLLKTFEYIFVECSFLELYQKQALAHEVITFLAKQGFNLKGIYNMSYDKFGVAVQGDFLFEAQ